MTSDSLTFTFAQHHALARAWLRWNGSTGSERQGLKLMHELSAEQLYRLLSQRGIVVHGCEPQEQEAS